MKSDNPMHECPNVETLSSFGDGDGLEGIEQHVAQCAKCQAALLAFRRIDTAVQRHLQPAPDLAARIKAACVREAAAQSPVLWPVFAWRLVAAAAVAIMAGAVFYIAAVQTGEAPRLASDMGKSDVSVPLAPVVTPSRVVVKTPVPAAPTADAVPGPRPASLANTIVPIQDLRPTGLGMASFSPGLILSGIESTRQSLPDAVRHVWVVADVVNAMKVFKGNLPKGIEPQFVSSLASSRLTYRVLLSDQDLQSMVDKLSAAGFSLVSPALPQPGSNQKLLVSGKPVLYELELVPATAVP